MNPCYTYIKRQIEARIVHIFICFIIIIYYFYLQALDEDNSLFEGNRIRIKRPLPPTETTLVVRSYADLSEPAISSVFTSAGKIRNVRRLVKGKKSMCKFNYRFTYFYDNLFFVFQKVVIKPIFMADLINFRIRFLKIY